MLINSFLFGEQQTQSFESLQISLPGNALNSEEFKILSLWWSVNEIFMGLKAMWHVFIWHFLQEVSVLVKQ